MPVNFHYHEIKFRLRQSSVLKKWIATVIKKEGFQLAQIDYIFCSDEHLLHINQQFLKHDFYTDIITFDFSKTERKIIGELYISVDRVKDNAATLAVSQTEELHRVIIHGVLHLCGYKDKSKADEKKMREKEEACLKMRG